MRPSMSGETPPPGLRTSCRSTFLRLSFTIFSPGLWDSYDWPSRSSGSRSSRTTPIVHLLPKVVRQTFVMRRTTNACWQRKILFDKLRRTSNVRKSSDVEYVRLSFDILHASNARRTVCEYFCSYTYRAFLEWYGLKYLFVCLNEELCARREKSSK